MPDWLRDDRNATVCGKVQFLPALTNMSLPFRPHPAHVNTRHVLVQAAQGGSAVKLLTVPGLDTTCGPAPQMEG